MTFFNKDGGVQGVYNRIYNRWNGKAQKSSFWNRQESVGVCGCSIKNCQSLRSKISTKKKKSKEEKEDFIIEQF